MAKNFMWGVDTQCTLPIHVVLFVSRHKDNKDIKDYKERRESFVTTMEADDPYLRDKFYAFVNQGKPNELSRMYYSVNSRKKEEVTKALVHFLIDNPDFNIAAISAKVAGLAAKSENALTHKWMFDFDSPDIDLAIEFSKDITEIDSTLNPEIFHTKNGHAIVVAHGFDTRKLMEKWTKKVEVELKRDDLLLVEWKTKC